RFDDLVRRAPQLVRPDSIERDLARRVPVRQLPELDGVRIGMRERVERHFQDLVDFALLAPPYRRQALQPTEKRRDAEPGGARLNDRQRRQHVHRSWRQSNFLLGFAQRRAQEVGIFGLAATAWKRDLSAVHAKRTSSNKDEPQATIAIAIQRR